MVMLVLFVGEIVVMLVGMLDLVGVSGAPVGMRHKMLVRVAVRLRQGIHHHDNSSQNHHGKPRQIRPRQLLPKDHKGQKRPDKRRNGIVSAGFGCPNHALRPNVKENAEPVRHKA